MELTWCFQSTRQAQRCQTRPQVTFGGFALPDQEGAMRVPGGQELSLSVLPAEVFEEPAAWTKTELVSRRLVLPYPAARPHASRDPTKDASLCSRGGQESGIHWGSRCPVPSPPRPGACFLALQPGSGQIWPGLRLPSGGTGWGENIEPRRHIHSRFRLQAVHPGDEVIRNVPFLASGERLGLPPLPTPETRPEDRPASAPQSC